MGEEIEKNKKLLKEILKSQAEKSFLTKWIPFFAASRSVKELLIYNISKEQ
jgi:hypothetical protein